MEENLVISELELEELSQAAGGAATVYKIHIVKKGENLTAIAKMYGTTWKKIYALNRDIIKNPNIIKPGWKLTVPVEV